MMKKEITTELYDMALLRIEELLPLVNENTLPGDRNAVELSLMSDIVIEYEEKNFPVSIPSLAEMMKLKLEESSLSQKDLAYKLGVSPSRISEYLNGKCEPTLKIARLINKELHIPANVILGV